MPCHPNNTKQPTASPREIQTPPPLLTRIASNHLVALFVTHPSHRSQVSVTLQWHTCRVLCSRLTPPDHWSSTVPISFNEKFTSCHYETCLGSSVKHFSCLQSQISCLLWLSASVVIRMSIFEPIKSSQMCFCFNERCFAVRTFIGPSISSIW